MVEYLAGLAALLMVLLVLGLVAVFTFMWGVLTVLVILHRATRGVSWIIIVIIVAALSVLKCSTDEESFFITAVVAGLFWIFVVTPLSWLFQGKLAPRRDGRDEVPVEAAIATAILMAGGVALTTYTVITACAAAVTGCGQ